MYSRFGSRGKQFYQVDCAAADIYPSMMTEIYNIIMLKSCITVDQTFVSLG